MCATLIERFFRLSWNYCCIKASEKSKIICGNNYFKLISEWIQFDANRRRKWGASIEKIKYWETFIPQIAEPTLYGD